MSTKPSNLFLIPYSSLVYNGTNYRLVDPSKVDSPTQVVDPDGTVGDLFGVGDFTETSQYGGCQDTAHLCLSFISAPEGQNVFDSPFDFLPIVNETPGSNVWSATGYLNPELRTLGFTATFSSDIPEPTSLALVGLGGLAISFARCTSRKRS